MKLRTLSILVACVLLNGMLTVAVVRSTETGQSKGYSRNIPPDPRPSDTDAVNGFLEMPSERTNGPFANRVDRTRQMSREAQKALAEAESAESRYQRALEANQKKPGAIPATEIDRLHQHASDRLLTANSKQVQFLQAEVANLRREVEDLRTVKIRPVQNSDHK